MKHSVTYIVTNGITGLAGSSIAVLTTFQEQLEWWVRISGGGLGIVIAVVTLWKLLTHPKKI